MSDWRAGLTTPERAARRERRSRVPKDARMRGMFFSRVQQLLPHDVADPASLSPAGGEGVRYARLRNYPLQDFLDLQTRAAEELVGAGTTFEEAVFLIGEACVESFFESVAGRAMRLLAGRDPHRLLSTAPNGYRVAIDDGGSRAYERLGAQEGRFTFKDDLLGPCHQAGTFSAALRAACGVSPDIQIEQRGPWDFTFHLRWPARADAEVIG